MRYLIMTQAQTRHCMDEVYRLRNEDGLKFREIAEKLGIRLTRAHALYKKKAREVRLRELLNVPDKRLFNKGGRPGGCK